MTNANEVLAKILSLLFISVGHGLVICYIVKFLVNDLKIIFRYYPKHYCRVPRWMQKYLKIKRKEAPKFLCALAWSALLPFIMPLIVIPAWWIFGKNALVVGFRIFFWSYGFFTAICVVIIYPIFKRGDKKKRKNIR